MAYDMDDSKNAIFNMGIATLMRLDGILQSIREVSSFQGIPLEIKQASKIELVKQFFINACPLLKADTIKDLRSKYLELKPEQVEIVDSVTGKVKGKKNIYSGELDDKLNELLVDIQVELQEEGKYYMPAKRDLSKAVLNM